MTDNIVFFFHPLSFYVVCVRAHKTAKTKEKVVAMRLLAAIRK